MIDEAKQVYEFDEFRLDLRKRQLFSNNEVVPLYSKAFDLLSVLVKNGGRDLAKDELLDMVWPGQILEEANLSVTMSAIRKALREKASEPRYIVTIPGRGYRFVADFNEGETGADDLVIDTETVSRITIDEEATPDQFTGKENSKNLVYVRPEQLTGTNSPVSSGLLTGRNILVGTLLLVGVLTVAGAFIGRRLRRPPVGTALFTNIKVTPVTNTGRLGTVAISADGKLFAFNQKALGEERGKNGLYLGQIDAEKTVELIAPDEVFYRSLEYASDGSAIFFTRQNQGKSECSLFRISVLGGLPVKLHNDVGFYISIAPDNHRVAFVRDNPGNNTSSIMMANLESGSESQFVSLPSERRLGRFTGWSPDGSTIAFAANQEPNGASLAIFLADVRTGQFKPLTAALWRDVRKIVWLKDGSGLLMIAAGIDPEDKRQVWFISTASGEARRITNDPSIYDWGLSVPADPNSFLLVQLKQFNNLWAGPANELSKEKQITFTTFNTLNGNFVFDWLPNHKIVYASSSQGHGLNLSMMNADGSDVKELTPPGNDDSYPVATPDGRFIVFMSRRSGNFEIWRIDSDGTHAKQMTDCGANSQPSISTDGKWIVYVSRCDHKDTLWRIPIDGGQPERMTDKPAQWAWFSPDGKWFACTYESSPGRWQLAIIPAAGGSPAKLFDATPLGLFTFAIRWTPDSKSVTYRDSSKGLWRQPIDGGAPQQIPDLPDDKIYCYGWSRDGKLFAFSRGQEIRDAILISNAK